MQIAGNCPDRGIKKTVSAEITFEPENEHDENDSNDLSLTEAPEIDNEAVAVGGAGGILRGDKEKRRKTEGKKTEGSVNNEIPRKIEYNTNNDDEDDVSVISDQTLPSVVHKYDVRERNKKKSSICIIQ